MKIFINKMFVVILFVSILISSSKFLVAQQKLMGDLSITKISAAGFVTVNEERVVEGRSIASGSSIVTSSQASARVSLSKIGTVSMSPDSQVNLSFINAAISLDITSGGSTIETTPGTALNVLVPDGNITLTDITQANSVKVTVIKGKTVVQSISGKVQFNNVFVTTGETYPDTTLNKTANDNSSNNSASFNPLLIIGGLGAAVAVAALLALSSSSGNSDNPTTSPTR